MSSGPSTPESKAEKPRSGASSALKIALPVLVLLLILGGVTLLLVGGSSKPTLPGHATTASAAAFAGAAVSPPEPAPPLDTLRNYDGSRFDLAAQHGKAAFVTFLYTHCPDVCPLIAANLHNAYAKMTPAQRSKVAIVAVSVDPHGDTAKSVAAFMRSHQLAGEGDYLIGSAHQLARVWTAWKVGSENDTSSPDLVNHSALIYGVSASGRLYTLYAASFQPSEIVHDVQPLLAH